ncbi:MAG TPA: glycosyltransferase family 9 protein [Ignavibacteria bacterium]|nr:glycosyltransferase family 9 protein [Ignavibacteria bacterium]
MELKDPKSIVIVQIGKIGDMILTTPLFSGIKRIYPEAKLTVLSSKINKDIPLNHPSVDEVIVYKKNIFKNFSLLFSTVKNPDLWIDIKDNYSRTSELLLKIFKPKISIGYNFGNKIFDISLKEYQKGNHAVDINTSPVYYLTGKKDIPERIPSFEIPENIQNKISAAINKNPYQINILINISAGSKSRYIKKEQWVKVINMIHQTGLFYFYLTGLEKDMEDIEYILKNTVRDNVKFIRTENIIETAELLRKCSAVITADTSIVHLCSAFDKPVVAMYPDVKWNLDKFAPLSQSHEVIISKSAENIEDIDSERIVKSFSKLIISGNAESRTRVRKEDH